MTCRHLRPTDSQGYAPIPIDNDCVQYGLNALEQGIIGVDEFLRLNACVGRLEGTGGLRAGGRARTTPTTAATCLRSASCRETGRHARSAPQRQRGRDGTMPTRRARCSPASGWAIPMIDLRPYLDPELNMHNARQSFSGAGAPAGRQPRPGKAPGDLVHPLGDRHGRPCGWKPCR